MHVDIIIVILSVLIGIRADRYYYVELSAPGHNPPNRWSWLIWCFSSYVEVATFEGISNDWVKVIPLATTPIACTILFYKVWQMKEDKWESRLDKLVDLFSVIASISAIIIWLIFKEELWAHIMMICAVPVSYIPTWRSLPKTASVGASNPWMWWTMMDALNLILNFRRLNDLVEIPYVAVELVCHASIWFIVGFRRSA